MPPRIQQPLADGDGLGKRPGRILERRQHEVAQRVVASEREAVLERLGQRVVRVRSHCGDALAHVARRRDVGFLAQDAGGAAVVGHGDDGARIQSHGQENKQTLYTKLGSGTTAINLNDVSYFEGILKKTIVHYVNAPKQTLNEPLKDIEKEILNTNFITHTSKLHCKSYIHNSIHQNKSQYSRP